MAFGGILNSTKFIAESVLGDSCWSDVVGSNKTFRINVSVCLDTTQCQ